MRNTMKLLAAVAVSVLLTAGCAGRRQSMFDEHAKPRLNTGLKLPDFVLNPPTIRTERGETFIYGSGQCAVYINEADADLAITTADNLARQEILSAIETRMASGYQYFNQISGNTNPDVSRAYNNALVTSAARDIPGIEIVKREYTDGVIYSQARWSRSAANVSAVIESVRQELAKSNVEAARSMYEARQVWERLHGDLGSGQ